MSLTTALLFVLTVVVTLLCLGFAAHQRAIERLVGLEMNGNRLGNGVATRGLQVGASIPSALREIVTSNDFEVLFASSGCSVCREYLDRHGRASNVEAHVIWRGPSGSLPDASSGVTVHQDNGLFHQLRVDGTPLLLEVKDGVVERIGMPQVGL